MPAAGWGRMPTRPLTSCIPGRWQQEFSLYPREGGKPGKAAGALGFLMLGAVLPPEHHWEGTHAAASAPSLASSRNGTQKVLFFTKPSVPPADVPCQGTSSKTPTQRQEKPSIFGLFGEQAPFSKLLGWPQAQHSPNLPKSK